MSNSAAAPVLSVSKKSLSMFLRTRCQKELFLSLYRGPDMAGLNLPEPIKRPGIGTLSVEGKAFEASRNDELAAMFPGIVRAKKSNTEYTYLDLASELTNLVSAPALVLQGKFSVKGHQQPILAKIGIGPADIALVPPITDLAPDIIYVRLPQNADAEVLPDGTQGPIDPATEARKALCIIDIKHTSEANPSYCSEIAMYALMLSNWLALDPVLKDRYFVALDARLWTRSAQGKSAWETKKNAGASQQVLLDALLEDCEDAQLRYYLRAIAGFFAQVAHVVRVGQGTIDGWKQLDWHVAGSCASCDWLGDKRHMGAGERAKVDANPDHYCMTRAQGSGHLCLVPGITKGAKKVLIANAVADVSSLAGATGHAAFQHHTLLKREAKTLPLRSTALATDQVSIDANGVIASLVRSANLLLYATINFDSSAGLLTGLALSGVATNYTKGQSPRRFQATAFVVDEKALDAEWVALEGFLTQIASCIEVAEKLENLPKGQIHFWEERQFTELCNAMGRHLPRVMALADRKAKALAWVFAESKTMVARPESLSASTVTTVDDIVRRLVFAPTPHVITLFDTAERYSPGTKITRDSYYREFLANGIPRERIYEIWSKAQQVRRGSTTLPRNTVISQYSQALEVQCSALEGVCTKLRSDFGANFRAKATSIPTSIPQGARSVAFDAKLWLWWDQLNFHAKQLEAHMKLAMDGERLEASYEAIVLLAGVRVGVDEYEFQVGAGSREAKFKEESILTLGKIGLPGMPLQKASTLIPLGAPPYLGNQSILERPWWSLVQVKLLDFDRTALTARIRLSAYDRDLSTGQPTLATYLVDNALPSLLSDVFLAESKSPAAFNWAEHAAPIFGAIGQPAIAHADPNAARAMGIKPTAKASGSSKTHPAARVLWEPSALEGIQRVPQAQAQARAASIGQDDGLNDSQIAAATHGLSRALTLIWGPPGTGKTNTLASALHAIVRDAHQQGVPVRVLVAGPTYKAVEEVLARAMKFMGADPAAACELFMAYAQDRTPAPLASAAGHVAYVPMVISSDNSERQQCVQRLMQGPGATIVGAQVRQARRFPKLIGGGDLEGVFDVVILDESSQVPVAHAVAAFAGLKDDGRLVIAGDHLQMPPIVAIQAPVDAAYLVGSIHTYLTQRPFSAPVTQRVLERNYRSNAHIVEFAKRIGYPSSLVAEYPDTQLALVQPLPDKSAFPTQLPWSAAFARVLHPDTKVCTLLHQDDVSSQGNRFEARLIASMIWMLRQSVSADLAHHAVVPAHQAPSAERFWDRCVGIVTPHRAQRAMIMQELEAIWPSEADLISGAVDTVERFQGGERHTIIVSFGVADVDVIGGEEAFLMQLERTNVAVSRAMGKCIVVMPDALAAHIPEDKRALQTAFALKDYIEEFCDVRQAVQFELGNDIRPGQVRFKS